MEEIFAYILLVDLLGLFVFVIVVTVFNRKYSASLDKLIEGLPEQAYEKLKEQSREGIDSLKEVLKENLKAQFRQPDYLVNLIMSEEFDSFGVKGLREECYKNYRRYKKAFSIIVVLLLLLFLSFAGMVIA